MDKSEPLYCEHTGNSTICDACMSPPQPPATGLVKRSVAVGMDKNYNIQYADAYLVADVEARDTAIVEALRAMRRLSKDHHKTLEVQCFSDDEWWGRNPQGSSDEWIIDKLLAQLRGGGA